jgi:hypothetical protein
MLCLSVPIHHQILPLHTDRAHHQPVSPPSPLLRTICWVLVVSLDLGGMSNAFAQTGADASTPEICGFDLSIIKTNEPITDNNIVTADTVSPTGTTIPSLWWTSEEFSAKFITNWIADRRTSQIYLLVNTQYWNTLDYLDRYRTIARFGRVAQRYGYNLKVCNSQKIQIGSYACAPTPPPPDDRAVPQSSCQILFDTSGQTGLGVN